jgi:hypothetical protein
MNWPVLLLVSALALAGIILMIRQNIKDERSFTDQLNRNYRKRKKEECDTDAEDPRR